MMNSLRQLPIASLIHPIYLCHSKGARKRASGKAAEPSVDGIVKEYKVNIEWQIGILCFVNKNSLVSHPASYPSPAAFSPSCYA